MRLRAILSRIYFAFLIICEALAVDVKVYSEDDIIKNTDLCNPSNPSMSCNFRSAIGYCETARPSECIITMMYNKMNVVFSTSFGTIVITPPFKLIIKGNDATFSPSAQNVVSFLYVNGMYQNTIKVEIYDVTVSGFGITTSEGGAILVQYVALFATDNVIFKNNKAKNGGALEFSYCSKVSFKSTFFFNNIATDSGGGVYFAYSTTDTTLSDSIFISNTAGTIETPYLGGGALMFNFGNNNVKIVNCTFDGNISPFGSGGAVGSLYYNNYMSIKNSTFLSNTALKGGAFFQSQGDHFDVQWCTFDGNSAQSGGAVYLYASVTAVTLTDSVFTNNEADADGGALVTYTSVSDMYVKRCLFEQNQAGTTGGAFYSYSTNRQVHFYECLFSDNVALHSGGSISMDFASTSFFFDFCIFIGNSAYFSSTDGSVVGDGDGSGGAVFARALNDGIYFLGCHFMSNYAQVNGGAFQILVGNKNLVFDVCEFVGNVAGDNGGSGHLTNSNSGVVISNCLFQSNVAVGGGALHLELGNNDTYIHRNLFINNFALNNGGALLVRSDNTFTKVADCEWLNNMAYQGNGGALYYISGNRYSDVINCVFKNNTAKQYGGAVGLQCDNSYLTISNSVIEENSAFAGAGIHSSLLNSYLLLKNVTVTKNLCDSYGGGVFVGSDHYHISFEATSFLFNTAISGGALYISTTNTRISFNACNISGNIAYSSNGGGVVVLESSDLSVVNSTFLSNYAWLEGGAVFLNSVNLVVMYDSIFLGNSGKVGGAISLSVCSGVELKGVTLSYNEAIENGGGMAFVDSSLLSLRVCKLDNNIAGVYGGSIFIAKSYECNITTTLMSRNTARVGAGIFATDSMTVTASQVTLMSSYAEQGSGIAVTNSYQFTIQNSSICANIAYAGHGSGVLVNDTTAVYVAHNSFLNNNASRGGGTFYWKNQREEDAIIEFGNSFVGNSALYGNSLATEGVSLRIALNNGSSSNELMVSDYNVPLTAFTVRLVDRYEQTVITDSQSFITISVNDSQSCSQGQGYVSGSAVEKLQQGVANFDELYIHCSPNGDATLEIISTTGYVSYIEVRFRKCYVGEYYAEGEGSCLSCPQGSYSFDSNSDLSVTECNECPNEASLCLGSTMMLRSGYWRISPYAVTPIFCPIGENSCNGGNQTGVSSCSDGYTGPLCAVCDDGYYFSSFTLSCTSCSDFSITPSSIVVCVLVIMTVLYLMLRHVFKLTLTAYEQKILKIIQLATSHNNIVLNSRKSNFPLMQIKARLKVYLAFYQIIIAAPYVLNMRFPKLFYNLSGPFTFLNFNLLQDSGSSCSLFPNMDYVDVLMFSTLAPFVMACVVFSVMFLHISYNRYIKHISSSTDVRQSYYQGFLIFLYFALPAISTMIFRTFSCRDVDPDNCIDGDDLYMAADYRISCSSDRYIFAVNWAIISAIIYPLGVPCYFFYILKSSHNEKQRHLDSISITKFASQSSQSDDNVSMTASDKKLFFSSLSFLYAIYTERYWYWEIVETIQRITFTGFLSVFAEGTSLQIVIAIFLSSLFIHLFLAHRPFSDKYTESVKVMLLWQVALVFFLALAFKNGILSDYHTLWQALWVMALFASLFLEAVWFLGYLVANNNQNINESTVKDRKDSSLQDFELPLDVDEYKNAQVKSLRMELYTANEELSRARQSKEKVEKKLLEFLSDGISDDSRGQSHQSMEIDHSEMPDRFKRLPSNAGRREDSGVIRSPLASLI